MTYSNNSYRVYFTTCGKWAFKPIEPAKKAIKYAEKWDKRWSDLYETEHEAAQAADDAEFEDLQIE